MSKTVFKSKDPTIEDSWSQGNGSRGITILNRIEVLSREPRKDTIEDIMPTRAKLYKLMKTFKDNKDYENLLVKVRQGYTLTREQAKMIETHYREMITKIN
jgi:hypothetical protein